MVLNSWKLQWHCNSFLGIKIAIFNNDTNSIKVKKKAPIAGSLALATVPGKQAREIGAIPSIGIFAVASGGMNCGIATSLPNERKAHLVDEGNRAGTGEGDGFHIMN